MFARKREELVLVLVLIVLIFDVSTTTYVVKIKRFLCFQRSHPCEKLPQQ